jgi:hypothetical protein
MATTGYTGLSNATPKEGLDLRRLVEATTGRPLDYSQPGEQELVQRVSNAMYGDVGANLDARDWKSIMASSNPLEAAEKALTAMYNDKDYLVANASHVLGQGYLPEQADITYKQMESRVGSTYDPNWSAGSQFAGKIDTPGFLASEGGTTKPWQSKFAYYPSYLKATSGARSPSLPPLKSVEELAAEAAEAAPPSLSFQTPNFLSPTEMIPSSSRLPVSALPAYTFSPITTPIPSAVPQPQAPVDTQLPSIQQSVQDQFQQRVFGVPRSDIEQFIASRSPQPRVPEYSPMLTPTVSRQQLEQLNRLYGIPQTPPQDDNMQFFREGGAVKKFADGGPSSGVRRLEMSGYQAGGEVSSEVYPHLKEKYGIKSAYLDPEMLKFQEKAGRLPNLLYEQLATLASIEDTQGVDLTKDPVLRKTLFKDQDVRETYNALTGLRMTRLDARDLPPMTRVPEKGSEKEAGLTDRIKKMLGFSKGGDVSNDEFIQEMMFTGTRPEDFPETSPVDKKAGELLRALSEGTRGFVGAEPIEAGSEAYRTGQALANMPAVGVVAGTVKGAGKAKDALKALTKKDIKLIASELETSRGQLSELAKKYPQLRDASVADIEALTGDEPFTAFRGISLLPGRELRKESTPSMTVDPSVALGMLKDAPVMITKEGFITATPVLRQYPGMKASETQVYVPSLIEQITERQPGALEMKIPTRSGEKMTVADVFKEVKGEKELLADVSKKEPRDILFDRYQGGVGDRYLMEVARRVLAGKWDGGEALLKEIGGYQTDPKGLVQEFDSFAELVKESALKKAKGGEVTNDEFIQEMMTGTRPTDLPVKREEEGVSNDNSTQEMFTGTRPSDFPETSPVDTAVSDFVSSRSKLVTDPQEFFRVMGQNLEEYHSKPLREDPQKYLTEQLGPGALAGTVGKTAKQLFSSLPSSEAPFVSRLDEFVSSLPGAVQKDQFLNQLKGKFRDYDIGRAQEALADLPGNAKLTPFDLLNRVKRVYDPTTFTTKIDLPKAEDDYHAGMDNPFKTKEGFSQKPLGVIHLLQGVNPATSPDAGKLMAAYDDIVNRLPDTSFNIFDKTDRNPVSLAQDIYKIANRAGLSSVKDLGMDVQTVLQNMAQSGSDWNTLVSSKHRLGHPGSYKPEEIKEALSETARITGTLPEENVKSLQKIAEEINARRTAKEDYSDLESQYHKSFPYAFAEDLEKANRRLWDEHSAGKKQIKSLLEGLQKREGINTRAYKGQHSSLAEDPSTIRDPIAFSRFTEHTTDIPGLGKVDGIYVNELQSDRLDDIRKKGRIGGGPQEDITRLDKLDKQVGEAAKQLADYKSAMGFRFMNESDIATVSEFNSKLEGLSNKRNTLLGRIREGEYSLKESFAGMEESPQVIQQLMAKNAVAGAMQLGKRFVAFPGAESAQAQLYEKLPNNLKQVVKDLGPGFELRPITLPKPDTSAGGEGGELTSYAIVWGDEAADRIKKQGVPFKDGGEVSTEDFIKRFSKGGATEDESWKDEMFVGTRPSDEATRPGILPPELREAIDVPLDLANLAIRGTVGAVAGPAYGLYKGITGGKYGTREGVTEARSEAERMMGEITGEPKTQAAKDIMQSCR